MSLPEQIQHSFHEIKDIGAPVLSTINCQDTCEHPQHMFDDDCKTYIYLFKFVAPMIKNFDHFHQITTIHTIPAQSHSINNYFFMLLFISGATKKKKVGDFTSKPYLVPQSIEIETQTDWSWIETMKLIQKQKSGGEHSMNNS